MRNAATWIILTLTTACAGGDDGGEGGSGGGASSSGNAGVTCERFADKLRECGLVEGAGAVPCMPPTTPTDRCQMSCILNLSCADVEASLCWSGTFDYEVPDKQPVGMCFRDCHDMRTVDCPGQSNPPIDGATRCDGIAQCLDRSDEFACDDAGFVCDDGEQLHESMRCDGLSDDCQDGSDERGCAMFDCGDGTQVNQRFRCDKAEDCQGGSDELDCATLSCG